MRRASGRGAARRTAAGGPQPIELREEFDPALIAALYNNFRSSLEALLELVDNAIDDRVPGRPLTIDLRLRRGTLRLVNRGGAGMGLEELADFLRWGGSRKVGKLGRYGQGGKAALGYLGRGWRVQAIREGSDTAYAIEETDWHDRSRGLKRYRPREIRQLFPAPEGHVEITVTRLQRRLFPSRVAARLAEVYRPLLLEGSVAIRVNGQPVAPAPLPALRLIELDEVVRVGGEVHPVCGWLGLLEPPAPGHPPAGGAGAGDGPAEGVHGGVRCYAFGRLIAPGEYFGHPNATQRLALGRLVGEVHLDFVPLIMNKTDFDRDSEAWQVVSRLLHEKLAPLVEELSRERVPGERVSRREKQLAREVEALLARLLRHLAEQERLPATDADVPGAAEADLLSRRMEPTAPSGGPAEAPAGTAADRPAAGDDAAETAAPDEEAAATGAPPGASSRRGEEGPGETPRARRRRKRRALPIEIRPLEESVRYQRVARSGRESRAGRGQPDDDGEEVLVVNNRFPLYRLRGGDRLYLLETAALELARSDDTTSAEEFIQEVNRLLYEAGRLLMSPPGRPRRLRR